MKFWDAAAGQHLATTELAVDEPLTITLDARAGKPMSIATPRADAGNALFSVRAIWPNGDGARDAAPRQARS